MTCDDEKSFLLIINIPSLATPYRLGAGLSYDSSSTVWVSSKSLEFKDVNDGGLDDTVMDAMANTESNNYTVYYVLLSIYSDIRNSDLN